MNALEQSSVVANCLMNRERRLPGYNRELGVDVLDVLRRRAGRPVRWLDLCCGTATALGEAAHLVGDGVEIVGVSAGRRLTADLRSRGLDHDRRTRRIRCSGRRVFEFPYRYLGADDQAGPNYTGQPAVTSYYTSREGL
ncbi:hypothetical protein ABT294_24720 [Nonomuraea sp. NPDC000554]|uniref:hypothetical protein n=1 Tax=Nonomuraea sp. NPDC000554 TaxID=3154259 RepID=UPI00332A2414